MTSQPVTSLEQQAGNSRAITPSLAGPQGLICCQDGKRGLYPDSWSKLASWKERVLHTHQMPAVCLVSTTAFCLKGPSGVYHAILLPGGRSPPTV